METPSSTRRVTRSFTRSVQASNIPLSTRKMEDSENTVSKSRQRERSVLIDITNDSPIVGLASGNVETPSSWRSRIKKAQGQGSASGEALLRGQVKTLLQKVEEEAELSKLPLVIGTPANTPQIPNLSLVVQVEQHSVSDDQVVKQGSPESEKNQLSRSLLLDFSDKSDPSSELTYEQVIGRDKDKATTEEDEACLWFASTHDEETEEDYYEQEEEEDEGWVDELCEGLNKLSVTKFEGKHTRFVYNSDDELVGEEEEEEASGESEDVASPSVVRLKGLPTPKGKHLRFPEEEEEDKKKMTL
ncbi:acidic leucine-rich nuclear phosphoprotein 32 family member A-like [Senna tora]|uniref:Acidic leucine-rich nuclear phosphoprotein 32 family member A-like n=1 Tax=Senna tora TaxID=362788 RepID=A0A834TUU6_9FABA|nr:acidic leucine-rich nuclear phosphoprotein 32 family member A-like [Senna tora]